MYDSKKTKSSTYSKNTFSEIPSSLMEQLFVPGKPYRGHTQTMWTIFWPFLTPPPPCGPSMDF